MSLNKAVQETKANYIMPWAGKQAHKHLNTEPNVHTNDTGKILQKLKNADKTSQMILQPSQSCIL